jgi:hypothetical protein
MEYTCLINFFTENENVYKEHNGIMHLYVEGTPSGINWIFRKDGTWGEVKKVDGKWKSNGTGKWRCDGNSNFMVENTIINKIYSTADETPNWKDKPQVEQPVTDNSDFSCVLKNKGNAAKVDSNGNYAWFWVDEPNKVIHIFYKKDNKWVQSKDGTEQFVGRWNCDEDNHFLIVTDDESYSSRSDNWEEISRVGDSNDSFPLKFGSKGPNVVKLQKFLNDKIRTNPLTVNGIFDQKTADKLIEFQKKEGIIE